jgi:uncharacterized sporulation protein YeaH/YhbH (DUF444 family)
MSLDLWDLGGQAERDKARHRKKIEDALKAHLDEVVANDTLLTAPDGHRVRIRLPEHREMRFRFARPGDGAGVGAGEGDGPVARAPRPRAGGRGAGSEHAEGEMVEVEVPVDLLADWLFERLALPGLRPRTEGDPEDDERLVARGPQGPVLDRKRTLLTHLRREKASGSPQPWREFDLVYRRWQPRPEPVIRAVAVLVRDASGSISERQRFLIRATCWWVVRWLRRNYRQIELRFVIHDSEALEVDEARFFAQGAMGGTRISRGLALAGQILEANYDHAHWNRYVLFFSDGENWPDDDEEVDQVLRSLAPEVELMAYGELRETPAPPSRLWHGLAGLAAQHPSIRFAPLGGSDDVPRWIRQAFGPAPEGLQGA